MSERLSRERLEEIAARAEAATEGPWEVGGGGGAHMDGTRDWYTVDCPWNERTKYRIGLAAMQLPEAEFVAHAREDVPALLAHLAALEAENASFRALVEAHEEIKATLKADVARLRVALRSWCVGCMALNPSHKCEGCDTNAALAALGEVGE